jgi:hypothetical protein
MGWPQAACRNKQGAAIQQRLSFYKDKMYLFQ